MSIVFALALLVSLVSSQVCTGTEAQPANCATPSTTTCTTAGFYDCTTCSATFFLDTATGQCVATCPTGTFADSTTGTCVATCPATYFADPTTSTCVQTCPATYYADSTTQTCVQTCPSGTFADATTSTCAACTAVANCAVSVTCTSATDSQCTSCTTGTFLDNTGTASVCAATCPTGYFTDSTTSTCVTACPTGTFADTTTNACTACTAVTDCTSTLTCTTAADSVCTACTAGFFLDTSLTSSTASLCVATCPTGYFADSASGACVVNCPVGTWGNITVCSPCDAVPAGCDTATATCNQADGTITCSACVADYFLNATACILCNSSYPLECTTVDCTTTPGVQVCTACNHANGYWLDTNAVCQVCDGSALTHCATYDCADGTGVATCTACDSTGGWTPDNTGACVCSVTLPTADGCTAISSCSPFVCTACDSTHFLNASSACEVCAPVGCTTPVCTGSAPTCSLCADGFYLVAGACVNCSTSVIDGCATQTCTNNIRTCTACSNATGEEYFLATDGSCTKGSCIEYGCGFSSENIACQDLTVNDRQCTCPDSTDLSAVVNGSNAFAGCSKGTKFTPETLGTFFSAHPEQFNNLFTAVNGTDGGVAFGNSSSANGQTHVEFTFFLKDGFTYADVEPQIVQIISNIFSVPEADVALTCNNCVKRATSLNLVATVTAPTTNGAASIQGMLSAVFALAAIALAF